ncbi:hypothetical protein Tsubulata_006478 [Turnera subulata]|uniref:Uncharacterized protein n=1 Tax=Turnera subulata TaxID=218843 RepID=A0A9Q0F889_9ROSI|nr:hypothetical protein Tsubulata_006478 [Turnera subulata]
MAGSPEFPGEAWLTSIKIEQSKKPLSNWSIWRVPNNLRNLDEDAYIPHLISIGPLHHGTKNVLAMESHKLHYMLALLDRTPDPVKAVDDCAKAIQRFDKHIRACYAEPISFTESDFAKMLFVDGCFIIELLIRYSMRNLGLQEDPVLTTWMVSTLRRDLALLENQIPFFVLEWLFKVIMMPSAIGRSLAALPELAFGFFKPVLFMKKEKFGVSKRTITHLLGLIHDSCLPPSRGRDPKGKRAWQFMHCATVLSKAGIEFEKDTSKDLFDLKFERGILKIPPLRIHDSTVSLYRNLIAYEQRFQGSAQYITSYFILMDHLIDTPKDVELLVQKRVLENDWGGWEEVSDLFNSICKQVVVQEFYYAGLCEEVNQHYNTEWYRYKADFRRDHCTNPWTIISLIAGSVLLVLTALQTVYSVLGYYQ